ncbi:MAG: winged helix-turn-helix domain-containing protein [Kordiimonas sp.]
MREFELKGWLVEPQSLKVSRNGEHHHLANKAMQLLCFLADNQGRVVTHEEIEEHVWDGNSFVAKKAATNTIWQLRKTLQGDLEQDEFIETIPRRGYRLNATVEYGSQKRSKFGQHTHVYSAAAIILTLVAITWLFSDIESNAPLFKREIITDYPGKETEPTLTVDGERIAFIWSQQNKAPNLYWKPTKDRSELPRQLTDTTETEATPSWSADGRSIAFLRINGETRNCSLHTVFVVTGVEQKLTDCQATKPGTLAWSPDGKWIAYAYNNGEYHGLGIISPKTREIREITRSPKPDIVDSDIAWSPDSKSIAYIRRVSVEDDQIYVTNLDGKKRHLEEAPNDMMGMAWSTDGDELIVAAVPKGEHRRQLLRLNTTDGKVIGKFDQGALEAYSPNLSGDGNVLAYEASNIVISLGSIWEGDEKVDEIPAISSLSTDKEPSVSSDGTAIAFTSTRSGSKEIWYHEVGSAVPTQVTDFGVQNVFGPVWQPGGDRLIFLAPGPKKNMQVFLFEKEGRRLVQLTHEETDHMPPSWSPDGKYFYTSFAVGNNWIVHKYAFLGVDEGAANPEAVTIGYASKESPTGSLFVFRLRTSSLHERKPDGEEDVFMTGFERRDWGNWIPTDKGIYALMRNEGQDQLVFSSYDGEVRDVAQLPARIVRSQNSMALDAVNNRIILAYYAMQQADIFGLRRAN